MRAVMRGDLLLRLTLSVVCYRYGLVGLRVHELNCTWNQIQSCLVTIQADCRHEGQL